MAALTNAGLGRRLVHLVLSNRVNATPPLNVSESDAGTGLAILDENAQPTGPARTRLLSGTCALREPLHAGDVGRAEMHPVAVQVAAVVVLVVRGSACPARICASRSGTAASRRW